MMIHTDKLRWLAWLRVKILFRNFQRRPATLIFTIIGLLFLLFGGGSVALGLFAAFLNLSAPANTELLYLLFTGLMLFWIVLPMLSYSTNEGLDVTKLQLFPLTRFELMFSLVFSSLFDIWTVLLVLVFGATIVAWWLNSLALGLLTLLVSVVFYVVMVGISQLILALLMRTLQSRRFRDLSVIILALFGSSCYIFSRFAFGASAILGIGKTLSEGGFSPYLQWLPSGVAASSIRAAVQGNWLLSFGMLGLLLIICALVLYLWQLVLERSMTASESGALKRSKRRQEVASSALASQSAAAVAVSAPAAMPVQEARASVQTQSAVPTRMGSLLEQLQALIRKELICFWRDPQLKVRMFQMLIYLFVAVIFPTINGASGGGRSGFFVSYTPFASVAVVFLLMLTLSLNTLGIERQSLTTLFLFPIDRRHLLWGKNLAVGLLGFLALIALMIFCAVTSRGGAMILPAAILGLAGMGITLGSGNISSVYFPRYQRNIGQRGYVASGGQAQSGGCLNQLMSLVMLLTTVILLTPAALGIALPFFLDAQWLWLVTMPLSLVYGAGLYLVFTNLAAQRMLAKEPEILALTTRE